MTAAAAAAPLLSPRRRWLATEVVQTSAMDCGPAALKSVLEGFFIRASYGRLREACQTDVDGTSIDTLEAVAPLLGVAAEQVLIPADHVCLPQAQALPAIAVVRLAPDGPTHFVVVWRQWGGWLQLMDPGTGRRWVRENHLMQELYSHEQSVPEGDWRSWAGSSDFQAPLARRLADLGLPAADAQALQAQALHDSGWFALGALDAATRLTHSLVQGRGIARGIEAAQLVHTLLQRCLAVPDDIHAVVPAQYWSATPDPHSAALGSLHLRVRGAVLVRLQGRVQRRPALAQQPGARLASDPAALPTTDARTTANQATAETATPPLSRELAAALNEKPEHPLAVVWRLLWQDGLLGPLALASAMSLAAGAMVVETLLLRGAIDLSAQLGTATQRVGALAALLLFALLLLALEVPIVRESLRHGRQLELRLRMALLAKLPQLSDRYFQSRSVGDMAERSHLLQLSRQLPSLGLNFVQTGAEVAFTLLGVALIAPASLPWALALALVAAGMPLLVQPMLAERDLRLRNHSSALHAFCLDALQGVVPARTHGAGHALRRQHEALLVPWVQASRRLISTGLAAGGVQALLCNALAAGLLLHHFSRAGGVGGADLLLVYWAIKLGAMGQRLAGLAMQYPAQRNVLMRLLEPLHAPDGDVAAGPGGVKPEAAATFLTAAGATLPTPVAAASIHIQQGRVVAAGQTILQDLSLHIAAGEHVAIVGASGAGKSTLLALLLGWHRLAQGSLLVDGQPLDKAALLLLRRHTAWVEPGVQLWNRSLLHNLSYASGEQSPHRLGAAMQAARLRGVLEKLPEGLQTRLGESGALLSGGEGQRVRLGRAFMQEAVRLVLLDEPFRGLDRDQRAQMLADARRWWQSATLLCVTHDVGETLAFDRVLVVDDGRIVEDGPPRLLAQSGTQYAALLQAEQQVHQELWQGAQWRRVQVREGRVHEGDSAQAMQPGQLQALHARTGLGAGLH